MKFYDTLLDEINKSSAYFSRFILKKKEEESSRHFREYLIIQEVNIDLDAIIYKIVILYHIDAMRNIEFTK